MAPISTESTESRSGSMSSSPALARAPAGAALPALGSAAAPARPRPGQPEQRQGGRRDDDGEQDAGHRLRVLAEQQRGEVGEAGADEPAEAGGQRPARGGGDEAENAAGERACRQPADEAQSHACGQAQAQQAPAPQGRRHQHGEDAKPEHLEADIGDHGAGIAEPVLHRRVGGIREARVVDRPRGQRHHGHGDGAEDEGADQAHRDADRDGRALGLAEIFEQGLCRHRPGHSTQTGGTRPGGGTRSEPMLGRHS